MPQELERKPSDARLLAEAASRRFWAEIERRQQSEAKMSRTVYTAPAAPLVEGRIVFTSAILEEVFLDPSKTADFSERFARFVFQEAGSDTPEKPLSLTGKKLDAEVKEELMRSLAEGISQEQRIKMLAREIEKMKKADDLARSIGINPSMMYLDDELYSDLIRAVYTPTGMVEEALEEHRAGVKAMPQVLNQFAERNDLSVNDPSVDRLMKSMMDVLVMISELRSQKAVGDEITRFWGKDGLRSLPEEIRANILAANLMLGSIPSDI